MTFQDRRGEFQDLCAAPTYLHTSVLLKHRMVAVACTHCQHIAKAATTHQPRLTLLIQPSSGTGTCIGHDGSTNQGRAASSHPSP